MDEKKVSVTLTTMLALEAEILAHLKQADVDETRDEWFKVRDGLCGEFASQLENVQTFVKSDD